MVDLMGTIRRLMFGENPDQVERLSELHRSIEELTKAGLKTDDAFVRVMEQDDVFDHYLHGLKATKHNRDIVRGKFDGS